MKKVLMILAVSFSFIVSCDPTPDGPSLHEQMYGRWKIVSYLEERYDQTANRVFNNQINCRPGDFMHFTQDKIDVHFDSTGTDEWSYNIFDHNTLLIEGKKWDIVKLTPFNFHLSSAERDSTLKQTDVVRFELVRP